MNRVKFDVLWRAVLGAVLLTGVIGCTAYYHDGSPVYTSAYHHSPYHYLYYPNTSVYFHISSGHYYYRDRDHWNRVKKLPPSHHIDRRDRVHLWIDADRPYSSHNDHHKKYRPKPHYKHDTIRDREERQDNQRQHERYRNR